MTSVERTASSFTDNLSVSDNGLMVYDEDENKFFFWVIDQWVELATGNLNGLPDQLNQGGKVLSTDGNTALWSDLDFNNLSNVPSGLEDGDDNTQLSDADIEDLGYVKTSDDADNDPSNENQTVSAGTGISITQTDDDFQVSNTSPDQILVLTDGGSGNVTIGGTYPNLSIDVPSNLDNDDTNEDQTVSAGTGISIAQTGDDFEVTNSSPDQTVVLTDGGSGNVTIGGTYPNLTIDVEDPIASDIAVTTTSDLSSTNVQDALEELQGEITTAASAAIVDGSVTTSKLSNLAVTNEKVNDIAFSKLTSVPTGLADGDDVDDADNDPNNEMNTGMSLSGTTVQVTDANSTQGVDIGGTFATDAELTASDAADADKSITNEIQDISTDGTAGDISLSDGSSLTLNVNDADASTTNEINTSMSLSGTTVQVTDANGTQGVDIGGVFATDLELAAINESQWTTNGSSINYTTGGVSIGSTAVPTAQLEIVTTTESNTIEVNNDFTGVGSKTGIAINLGNQGTTNKTGIHNDIIATAASTGALTGTLNEFEPANGAVIGTNTTIDANGTGLRFGSYNTINGAAGNSSDIYGFRAQLSHAGTGDSYAFYSQDFGSSSGTEYGVFLFGEDHSYFSGNIGIGEATPSAKLDVVGDTELNGELVVTDDIEIPAANDYTYASSQTRQMSYHPSEFKVLNVAVAEEVLLTPNSVNLYVSFSGGSGGLAFATAPVKLPNNAVITQLDCWVVDNNASEFVRLSLTRNQIGLVNFNQALAQVETTDADASTSVTQLTDNTIFVGTIDNSTYSYYLMFTSSGSNDPETQLHGVRITYTVSQAD